MGFESRRTLLRTLQQQAQTKNKLKSKALRSRREQKKGYHSWLRVLQQASETIATLARYLILTRSKRTSTFT